MKSNSRYFKRRKIIALDDFLEDVLYNNVYGYYSKNNPFGKAGDFITSPSISPLFSEMLAVWIITFWESLGKPNNFNIIELGPGNGNLTKILIKAFKNFPKFQSKLNFYMFEKSKKLKNIQKLNIQNKNIKWISSFKSLKKGPVLFFGNEFFDAIPIKQFKRIKNNIYEQYVYLNKKNKVKEKLIKAKKKNISDIKKFKILKKLKFIEFPKLGLNILKPMLDKINLEGGGLLLIDYGYVKQLNLNTLQSIKSHKQNKLFVNLGDADITSLVNFGILKEFFLQKKLNVENIVTQSFFLKKLGILERAEMLSFKMNFKEKTDLFLRLKRLLDPKYMGNLFKVILAHKKSLKEIVGFK
ncbi:MAG: SAM-dependent methyltransferase [Pelagibacteraceae bacterium]